MKAQRRLTNELASKSDLGPKPVSGGLRLC